MRFIQCLFIFALPILRSHPLVPRRKLVPFLFFYVFHFRFLFYFDTSNKPLNKVSNPETRSISFVGCNHQRTVSVFKGGFYLIISPAPLKFKVRGMQKNILLGRRASPFELKSKPLIQLLEKQ